MRRRALYVLVSVMLAVIAPLGTAASLHRVRVGIAFTTPAAAGAWVGKDRGFFRKHGVEAELLLFRGDTQGVQALAAGTVDLLMGGPVGAFPAVVNGVDIVEIATIDPIMPYIFVGRAGVTEPSHLKGKKIGVSGTGLAVSRLGVLIALRQFGLDVRRDGIALIPAGTTSERLAGLAYGAIDASVIDISLRPKVTELKLPVLADLAAQKVPFEDDGLMATRRFLAGRAEAAEGFLRGLVEANAYILDPANRRFSTRIIATHLNYDTVAQADWAYEDAVRNRIVRKPYPHLPGLEAMLAAAKVEFPELAKVDLNTFVDASLLRKIDQSGFIDRLSPPR